MTTFTATSRYSTDYEPLLSTAEVAALFGVRVPAVARWARDGRIPSARTPGSKGHRRYSQSGAAMLAREGTP